MSEGCCPLLEGMSGFWPGLGASVPDSGTKPLKVAQALRTRAHSMTKLITAVDLYAANCNQIRVCAPANRIMKFYEQL